MEQPKEDDQIISTFLNEHELSWLSWMQDIKLLKYQSAFSNINSITSQESMCMPLKTAIGLAKMTLLNATKNKDVNNAEKFMEALSLLGDQILIQEKVLHCLLQFGNGKEVLDILRPDFNQVYPSLHSIVSLQLEKLFEGKYLSVEAMVDILTLCVKIDDQRFADFYSFAYEMVYYSTNNAVTHEYVHALLCKVWRRAWLHNRFQNSRIFANIYLIYF
ncbi:hypothetical protein BJ742DRAFT_82406 [Cladochytrium replicatum]|nr:hypothetical protein BJ742DRAFT_82406 [Cladochytrium replicatum]